MQRTQSKAPTTVEGKTTIELEPDVREYITRRSKNEGRSLKWLINNAIRKEMLAEQALETQSELFKKQA